MEIQKNRKARIVLKEGTGAMEEYGKVFYGYIKDLTQEVKGFLKGKVSGMLLLVEDDFGESALVPYEEVDKIVYV